MEQLSNTFPIFDYVGFTFENVEGIYIKSHIFEHLSLSQLDTILTYSTKKKVMESHHVANEVYFTIKEDDLFNVENLNFRHMVGGKSSQEILSELRKHFLTYPNIVSIQFYHSETENEVSYYVNWSDEDEYINKYMDAQIEDGYIHVSIKE